MRFLITKPFFFPPNLKFTDPHSNPSFSNSSIFCFSRRISAPNSTTPSHSIADFGRSDSDSDSICGSDERDRTMGVLPERINGGEKMAMVFTYGTLKRGFSNHALMQELMSTKDAIFVGVCRTAERYPLVCGPYRVPFLLNKAGAGERVCGELYAVSRKGMMRMDELEGISRGHYERLPIKVVVAEEETAVEAEAYFGHRSYAEEMWRRNGERGYANYSEKEARGYVKRKDRPLNLTFLDHIRIFLTSPSSTV